MRIRLRSSAFVSLALFASAISFAAPTRIVSLSEKVIVSFDLNEAGAPRYSVEFNGKPALRESRLGLVRDDADFTTGLTLVGKSNAERLRNSYEILTSKRRHNTYAARRQVFHLQAKGGQKMDIIFQVSDDGVAFRYSFPETSPEVRRLKEEVSSFHFLLGTRAWLQPMSEARTGWAQTNPSYEEYYHKGIPVGTPSPLAGWVYPALFQSGDVWLLVSETALGRDYCGTRLRAESPDGEYTIGFADPREGMKGGAVTPESTLPWATPWRLIVVGTLSTIAESNLGVDLAEPPSMEFNAKGIPGKASWSWPLLGDRNTNFEVQKRFIDYAAEMGWRYCLIDALWDKQIGYEKMQELIDYGRTKKVAILLWYNSAGDWCTAPQTPRNVMLTRESRMREFERLKAMGIAGLKVDFFGGDGQSMIAYYHDILTDAAKYGLSINFHGATLPRGWQRTYPNLMTMESIKGLEFITFEQKNADEEPTHATMLPFTRNVFDPMDFTPVVLDRINKIQRRTTSAFELALSVLFMSGIQHYAEIPEGMAKAPQYVKDFMKEVPSVWEDVKLLDGMPGEYVVLARKGEGHWYVAGINGGKEPKTVKLDLHLLFARGNLTLITDGGTDPLGFRQVKVPVDRRRKVEVTLAPAGGFVFVVN